MSDKPTRVLIVEDEAIIAMDLAQRLENYGYTVTGIAASSDQAIELFDATSPDLVMMDIVIRGALDGVETAARLRERRDVPVIYLTAFSDDETLRRARATAPQGYLLKPFRPDDIRASIEVALVKHAMDSRLRQSEEWFSRTLCSIGEGVVATDTAGRVRMINPIAEALIGLTVAEVVGQPVGALLDLRHERSGLPVPDPVAGAMLLSGAPAQCPALLTTRSGAVTSVEYAASPIIAGDGELMGCVLVLRDIARRREMERALAESERRFHSAFEYAAIGMALVALDGRFLQANDVAVGMLGVHGEVIAGLSFLQLCHEGDRPMLDEYLGRLSANSLPSFQIELRLVTPDRRMVWALLSVSAVRDDHGNNGYYIVQMQDVTARRSAEEQLVFVAYTMPSPGSPTAPRSTASWSSPSPSAGAGASSWR